jgi:hypothetical protein
VSYVPFLEKKNNDMVLAYSVKIRVRLSRSMGQAQNIKNKPEDMQLKSNRTNTTGSWNFLLVNVAEDL